VTRIDAVYYDGNSSTVRRVVVDLGEPGMLRLQGEAAAEYSAGAITVETRLGDTPRQIRLSGGGLLETAEHDAIDAWLMRSGMRGTPWWQRIERYTGPALASLGLTVILYWAAIGHGIPLLAETVAINLPAEIDRSLGEQAWKQVDASMFEPSQLPTDARQAVADQFLRLQQLTPDTRSYRLEFRRGGAMGANAFAFPGGLIVITDELVPLAKQPEELTAVLAHEFGHAHYRHGLRTALQDSAIGLLIAAVTGDISWLGAALPLILVQTSYSRDFERQADRYAAEQLIRMEVSPAHLADMLDRLEQSHCRQQSCADQEFGWLSTHPLTAERGAALRGRRVEESRIGQ
jgi:predicted Zn-dependent protease